MLSIQSVVFEIRKLEEYEINEKNLSYTMQGIDKYIIFGTRSFQKGSAIVALNIYLNEMQPLKCHQRTIRRIIIFKMEEPSFRKKSNDSH